MLSKGKVFPIDQGVACQLKWTWNTVRLYESTSACCHRVKPVPITPDNFDNFHNHPTWLEHRRLQLSGNFPQQGCQVCEKVEKSGGFSDRMLHLLEEDIYPPELDSDPLAIEVTPRVLEVFLNNSCNLSCIYCDESNSSRIQKENEKFGYAVTGIPYYHESPKDPIRNIIPVQKSEPHHDVLVAKFFHYLAENYPTLRKLNVLGGEPFYQKEFAMLMDIVTHQSNPNLKLTVISNLMTSKDVLTEFIAKVKHALSNRRLSRVDLTASIDCFGDPQVYVRHGIDLDQWMTNFEYVLSHRWLYVNINNTITSLTIKTLPDLLRYVNDLRKTRPINHSFALVDARPHLHPEIFGPGYFDSSFDEICDLMPVITSWDQNLIKHMRGIQKSLQKQTENLEQQHRLKMYLDEIDRRRNLSWRSVFPWLAHHFERDNDVV